MTAPTTDEVDVAIAEVARRHDDALGQLATAFDETAATARELLAEIHDKGTDR